MKNFAHHPVKDKENWANKRNLMFTKQKQWVKKNKKGFKNLIYKKEEESWKILEF